MVVRVPLVIWVLVAEVVVSGPLQASTGGEEAASTRTAPGGGRGGGGAKSQNDRATTARPKGRALEVSQLGWGPAHYAAWDGDAATLEVLELDALLATDAAGETALHVSAYSGKTSTLEQLAARGVLTVMRLNGRGETAVGAAARLGRTTWLTRAAELRADLDAGIPSPAYHAALEGNAAVVDVLGRFGAKLDSPWRGWTPACAAAAEGHAETVAALARHGADVGASLEGERGFANPAWLAALNDRGDVVRELSKVVDLSSVAHPANGWSPVEHRAKKETVTSLRHVLEASPKREASARSRSPRAMLARPKRLGIRPF